ncbi:Mitochondrial 2-oxoglutarate/malate carrier protein [Hondaea fermentalgiana]|uniref:Mitochondrial 2-oxoglutarate/malate carrier protein n=1 Tax=Hondaea fermentalgiana TaxID=2315210 RepID=A0A2R5GI52_9STRA|nr:Mitochondrial 2-oxoglutarate/malate carrier protein [Hondaea fermentalgiana]|eukprot:GBG30567.1 Mitochondrial 2-oxoglutarate/malate carrier protein [Hondaea fermentalgiana]
MQGREDVRAAYMPPGLQAEAMTLQKRRQQVVALSAAAAPAAPVAETKKTIPTGVRFLFGTVSAVTATFFTHPVDVVKYHLQLAGKGGNAAAPTTTIGAGQDILKRQGPSGLYKGLTASMMRQVSYGTTRLGIYTTLMEKFAAPDGSPPPLAEKLAFSMVAGGVGAFVGNPFDLSLVRMAADSSLPEAQRRNYAGVMDAVSQIVRKEGFTSLWIGAGPTISRCIILNMAQLTTYSQAKEELLKTSFFNDNIWCHLASSMISGFVATAASLPFDVAKTRVQNAAKGEYAGMADCIMQTARHEGFLSLWKGFTPAYLRLAPQTVLVFVILEQLSNSYKRLFLS